MASKSKKAYHGTASIADGSDSDQEDFVAENYQTPVNILAPSSPKRKKRWAHVMILSSDEEEVETETRNQTSDISLSIGIENDRESSWTKRLRKRRSMTPTTIPSVTDDEEESNDQYIKTPGILRKRNRASVSKVQRALRLDHFKQMRQTSLDRKRSLSFGDPPPLVIDLEGPSSPEFPGHDVPEDYSSSDEFEGNLPFGMDDELKTYESSKDSSADDGSDEETDLSGFIVNDSSQSQENNDCAGGPIVKDGDFIALRDINENNIHELYQLVGTDLNWYMRLKNKKNFIATAEFVPVTGVNLDDYIGPIKVQHCPNVKEHQIVEIENELADVCNTLITESCGKTLKLESAKKPKQAVTDGHIHRKPSRKEAHAIYVQKICTAVLDSEFLALLKEKPVPYFDDAEKVIKEALNIRITSLVESSVWDARFKEMLINCRFLKRKPSNTRKAKCEACKRQRLITWSFAFYEADSDGKKMTPPMKKFAIGCDCAKRGFLYRKLVRYDFQLQTRCIKKTQLVKDKGTVSVKEVVEKCINAKKWLKMRFKDFENLLEEANGYAEEGKEHKRLKAKYH